MPILDGRRHWPYWVLPAVVIATLFLALAGNSTKPHASGTGVDIDPNQLIGVVWACTSPKSGSAQISDSQWTIVFEGDGTFRKLSPAAMPLPAATYTDGNYTVSGAQLKLVYRDFATDLDRENALNRESDLEAVAHGKARIITMRGIRFVPTP
jgi:hypothetical protein